MSDHLKLSIPKQIHVGYQNRQGTYTGKLAYVIYTDEKGKMRKEQSWQSWRDKKIEADNFANEPTSGFVLNKGVGGQRASWGWNARNEYIRVYDPRGFEFEISVANLLFILSESNSFKGKGLEGEFVYSWEGTELVLLPVNSFEYKASTEFTALQSMKITKSDMKEGRVYQHKNTNNLIYIGRFKMRDLHRCWGYEIAKLVLQLPQTPRHVFWNLDAKDWHFEQGFTKLAAMISEECHPEFANLHTKFNESKFVSKVARVVMKPIAVADVVAQQGRWFFIKVEKGYQLVCLGQSSYYSYYGHGFPQGMSKDHFWPSAPVVLTELTADNLDRGYGSHYQYDPRHSVSQSYIEDRELFTPEIQLQSNKTMEVYQYVERRKNQPVS